ncbi:hypothetical protein PTE30175_01954 [Pandoraea terrae]|uniref:Uncharacterized protein n=1 Tax=Pandoraea terrae TaxID=1537710 RepID=A0A5E4UFS5_9BURK|nr:hypothetical protein [Pandoraea terrae]VVD98885.1 hypothetical protein PTE30175_01954 [Pandoraea terrae]
MRLLTFDMTHSARQRLSALCMTALTAVGALCAAPVLAQGAEPQLRGAETQLAMVSDTGVVDKAVASVVATQAADDEAAAAQAKDESFSGAVATSVARIDDSSLGNERGRNAQGMTLTVPGMAANGVTLWDELPSSGVPLPRPQQLSNGSNVQVTRVTYTTR